MFMRLRSAELRRTTLRSRERQVFKIEIIFASPLILPREREYLILNRFWVWEKNARTEVEGSQKNQGIIDAL